MSDEFKPDDEEGRVRALERLDLLDSPEEATFENIICLVQKTLNMPFCAISLTDRDRQWFKARRGIKICEMPREQSFCSLAIAGEEPFIVRDTLEDPRCADNPFVTGEPYIRSYAGIPLRVAGGYNLGSLCVLDTKPHDFTPGEISILKQFAKSVVNEFELRQIAAVDHITKALSRRGWQECATAWYKQAMQEKAPLSLALINVDHFKEINDRIGYTAGDEVLTAFVDLCASQSREVDVLGRLNGDEFALLLPDTGLKGARAIAERLRKAFEAMVHPFGEGVRATVSIGVAELSFDDQGIEALLERAGHALANAKKSGRNCIFVASSESSDEQSGLVA